MGATGDSLVQIAFNMVNLSLTQIRIYSQGLLLQMTQKAIVKSSESLDGSGQDVDRRLWEP